MAAVVRRRGGVGCVPRLEAASSGRRACANQLPRLGRGRPDGRTEPVAAGIPIGSGGTPAVSEVNAGASEPFLGLYGRLRVTGGVVTIVPILK